MDVITIDLPWRDALAAFALLMRVGGFVMIAPMLGSDGLPARFRIGLAVLLVVVLAPVVPPPPPDVSFVALATRETVIGLVIGAVGRLALDALLFAGTFAGLSAGLSVGNLLDPVSHEQMATLGIFHRILGMFVYLVIGGHHQLLAVLARSYEVLPVGTASFSGPFLPAAVSMTGRVITFGFRLAAPVVVAGLVVDVCLMLIARAAPQMHVLIVGAPLRLASGLLAFGFSLHMLTPVFVETFEATLGDASQLLRALAAGS
jgi:flagellar biosynthetic protein FliR